MGGGVGTEGHGGLLSKLFPRVKCVSRYKPGEPVVRCVPGPGWELWTRRSMDTDGTMSCGQHRSATPSRGFSESRGNRVHSFIRPFSQQVTMELP